MWKYGVCISSWIKFWRSSWFGSFSRILWWYNCKHKFHTFWSYRIWRFSDERFLSSFDSCLLSRSSFGRFCLVFDLEPNEFAGFRFSMKNSVMVWFASIYSAQPSFFFLTIPCEMWSLKTMVAESISSDDCRLFLIWQTFELWTFRSQMRLRASGTMSFLELTSSWLGSNLTFSFS